MKKLIVTAACLLAGYSTTVFADAVCRSESVLTIVSDWEDYTTVSVLKVGRTGAKVRYPGCKVQCDCSGGSVRYRVYCLGDWHDVHSSDRSDYAYMFYAGSGKCYFNL